MANILWGSISQVQGPVVDIKFADELPGLRTAIEIINGAKRRNFHARLLQSFRALRYAHK